MACPRLPYEDPLPEREIWVELYSDAGHTVDRGLTPLPGKRAPFPFPITITRDQYVSLNDGAAGAGSDRLTGETVNPQKAGHPVWGLC